MRHGPKSHWLVGLLLLAMLAAACAPAAQPATQPAVQPAVQPVSPSASEEARSEAGRAADAAQAPAAARAPTLSAANKQAPLPDTGEQLIVKTATLGLLVPEVGEATTRAQNLAERLGGFVVTASRREESGRPAATVQMRVPAERFDEAMAQLRGLAERVQSEQVQSRDVTEEFVDTDARLRNLRATEQRYLDLLAQARSVEDILKIEQQLSNVRGQIEQLQGRLNFLQRSAELSTITVELRLPAAAQTPPPSEWALQPILRTALAALLATLQFLLGLLIFAAVFAPLWVPLVLLLRWLRGRRRRGREPGVGSQGAGLRGPAPGVTPGTPTANA